MLVCFGLSWPVNAIKAYKARTAKGTSPWFLILILVGYIAGVAAKFVSQNINYVLIMYFINIVMVLLNIFLYIRNLLLDKKAEKEEK